MLASTLRRTHVELQAHRQWLKTFSARSYHSGACHSGPHVRAERRSLGLQSRSYAYITPRHVRKRLQKESILGSQAQLDPKEAASVRLEEDLAQAITDVDVKGVIAAFGQITDHKRLDRTVTWRICQCLHQGLREQSRMRYQTAAHTYREDNEEKVIFAKSLAKRIRKGDLAPDHRAHMHLLSFFKEAGVQDAAVEFWQWLELQDDTYVSCDVYGSAIELLAIAGAPLAELETLFHRALERFPGTFHAYHLSPNAILSNREYPTITKGMPIILLQSIVTARLLRGSSRDAYLALDTMLRLYPTITPSRVFGLFINERPLAEAYTVFAMGCRAGVPIRHEHARKLITAVRTDAENLPPIERIARLRQLLSMAYIYLGGGGIISNNLVNELVIAVTQLLQASAIGSMEHKDKRLVVDAVMDIVRKMLEIFAREGKKPGLSAFNSIINNLAGHGQSKHIIGIALRDAHALGLEPNNVTSRSVLTAAGQIRDMDLVAQAWSELRDLKAKNLQKPDATDYHIFVKAAKLAGGDELAKETCKKTMIEDGLLEWQRVVVMERLDKTSSEGLTTAIKAVDVTILLEEIQKLRADLAVVDERTADRPAFQDFSTQTLPMTVLVPPAEQYLPETEMRMLYDEVTTEQPAQTGDVAPPEAAPVDSLTEAKTPPAVTTEQPAQNGDVAPPEAAPVDSLTEATPSFVVSVTNLSFGVLRYENWKLINYLLGWAEKHDKAYEEAVDLAIAKGIAPPPRGKMMSTIQEKADGYGLSDVGTVEGVAARPEDTNATQVQSARNEILRLRGLAEGSG
ncbi:hypothetical protein LTR08_005854 [Meristemomyces frigidus]|nr:hypothetical protein LTR08_005854 [Meristemomyces frigidus]